MTGGSGHKAQRNSEGSKARHNREFIDDLLDDYRRGEKTDGVYVGRVTRRMGCGRMEVFYTRPVIETEPEERLAYDRVDQTVKIRTEALQQIIPMRGGLRGKAKKTVWVDIDSLVMIAKTGLSGATHEIIAVFSPDQVARYRKLVPNADERLFLKSTDQQEDEGGIQFDVHADEDVDVEDI